MQLVQIVKNHFQRIQISTVDGYGRIFFLMIIINLGQESF